MGIRGCVGKTAVGRSHSAGTPQPPALFALSLNRTLHPPTIPQHGPPWEPLPSPTCEPLLALPRYVVCPVTLDHKIWVCSSRHKNSPTATDQKSPRKARVGFLGNGIRTSMLGCSSQHAFCILPPMALRFLKPRMSPLYLKDRQSVV